MSYSAPVRACPGRAMTTRLNRRVTLATAISRIVVAPPGNAVKDFFGFLFWSAALFRRFCFCGPHLLCVRLGPAHSYGAPSSDRRALFRSVSCSDRRQKQKRRKSAALQIVAQKSFTALPAQASPTDRNFS